MGLNLFRQTARRLNSHHSRRKHSFICVTNSYSHSPTHSDANSTTYSNRHLLDTFELSTRHGSKNWFSNSKGLIVIQQALVQNSCFSTATFKEKDDKPRDSKCVKGVPSWIDPYAHLAWMDKPIGTWLLAWPCMWSITMAVAPESLPDIKMMMLFDTGALLLRGAGCNISDLLDKYYLGLVV